MAELSDLDRIVPTQTSDPAPEAQTVDPGSAAPPDLFEIKWNNETKSVTRDELIALGQKGFDYTQKTTEVANQRKALDQERAELAEKIQFAEAMAQVFNDPEAKRQLATLLMGDQGGPSGIPQPPQVVTPPDPVTSLQRELASLRESLVSKEKSQILEERDAALASAKDQFPELKEVPGVDAAIQALAREKRPANPKEMRVALLESAKEIAEKVKGVVETKAKQSAAEQAKLRSIEPPSGQGLGPTQKTFYDKKSGDTDFRSLEKALIARLEAAKG